MRVSGVNGMKSVSHPNGASRGSWTGLTGTAMDMGGVTVKLLPWLTCAQSFRGIDRFELVHDEPWSTGVTVEEQVRRINA